MGAGTNRRLPVHPLLPPAVPRKVDREPGQRDDEEHVEVVRAATEEKENRAVDSDPRADGEVDHRLHEQPSLRQRSISVRCDREPDAPCEDPAADHAKKCEVYDRQAHEDIAEQIDLVEIDEPRGNGAFGAAIISATNAKSTRLMTIASQQTTASRWVRFTTSGSDARAAPADS